MDIRIIYYILWKENIKNYSQNKEKFICSEKATKFCEIFILLLSYVVPFNSKVEISQDSMAFSENMNFKRLLAPKCFFSNQTSLLCTLYLIVALS